MIKENGKRRGMYRLYRVNVLSCKLGVGLGWGGAVVKVCGGGSFSIGTRSDARAVMQGPSSC
jgi:hypothetical protein